MRKFLIDQSVKDIVKEFYSTASFLRGGKTQIELLQEYSDSLGWFCFNAKSKRKYIKKIIDELPIILEATPKEIVRLVGEFNLILDSSKIDTDFHKNVVRCMMYDELRQLILSPFQKLNLRTCVYCNSQLTIIVKEYYVRNSKKFGFRSGDVKNLIGRFDLDHIEPKAKYPFLSATFFNLAPSCGHCNQHKSEAEIPFKFYSDDPLSLDVFRFKIDEDSIEKYWKTKKASDLKFTFTHIGNDKNKEVLKEHAKRFKIPEIYKTQKDVFEELVHLSEVYTDEAQEDLVDSFKSLFPDQSMVHRLIVGNYTRPEEIHKRPLAKFTQDIATDLGLI